MCGLFLEINTVGILFAFLLFAALELMVNTYRLSRLLNMEVSAVVHVLMILLGIWLVGGAVVCYLGTTQWMEEIRLPHGDTLVSLFYFYDLRVCISFSH